jgi:hypothetical protein
MQVYPEQYRGSTRWVFWKYEVYALPANLPVCYGCPVSRRTKIPGLNIPGFFLLIEKGPSPLKGLGPFS